MAQKKKTKSKVTKAKTVAKTAGKTGAKATKTAAKSAKTKSSAKKATTKATAKKASKVVKPKTSAKASAKGSSKKANGAKSAVKKVQAKAKKTTKVSKKTAAPAKTKKTTAAKEKTKVAKTKETAAAKKKDTPQKQKEVQQVEIPLVDEMAAFANPSANEEAEVILTDSEGRRYCRVKDCDQLATVDAYCRYHYLLFWKKIQIRKKILEEGKLEKYIEELTARYPDKYLDMLRKDLRSEKEFLAAIQELEIDDSDENLDEEDSQSFIEEVRGISDSSGSRDDDY